MLLESVAKQLVETQTKHTKQLDALAQTQAGQIRRLERIESNLQGLTKLVGQVLDVQGKLVDEMAAIDKSLKERR